MTPIEAKEKWCCKEPTEMLCGAQKCMAWRWRRVKETKAFLETVQKRMEVYKGTAAGTFASASSYVFKNARLFEETEGYCGLAGKPE